MDDPPPPPPPPRQPPLTSPPRPALPPPMHPADALFREHAVLERQLPRHTTVHLTPEQRAWIPTELPDVLDLTNVVHALSLVGPNARFSRDVLAHLRTLVACCGDAVAAFKRHGDAVRALKTRARESADVTLAQVENEMGPLRRSMAEVQQASQTLQARLQELYVQQKDAPPLRNGSIEPRVYPIDSAEWLIRPIFYFKDEIAGDERLHTLSAFAQWTQQAMFDPTLRHMVQPLLVFLDALRPDGMCDTELVRVRVGDYMKHFKSSLPESVWLAGDSRKRAPPPPAPVRSTESAPRAATPRPDTRAQNRISDDGTRQRRLPPQHKVVIHWPAPMSSVTDNAAHTA